MEIQTNISWGLALQVWWHFAWRYVVFGLSGGMLLGILIGVLGGLAGMDIHAVTSLSIALGMFLVLFVQIWVVRRILTKTNRISKYRLVLVNDQSSD